MNATKPSQANPKHMTESIMKSRLTGEREGTYGMLMQLVAAKQIPECLNALKEMVFIGCWRDVRGFIRHFEKHGDPNDGETAVEIIEGCVRITNEQLRKDRDGCRQSWAAKWVPREPKCRASPLLRWYYDALAADMFPGAPDANRRFRKLITMLSPSTETLPGLVFLVRQAERAQSSDQVQRVNAQWQKHLARCKPLSTVVVPALSMAHSMGPGHNNCLHAGIGLALHFFHLSPLSQLLTFSSHAEWQDFAACPDFVAQVQHLLRAARSSTNSLNSNVKAIMNAVSSTPGTTLLIISDMEHDEPESASDASAVSAMTWNVSRNGRPASFQGDNPRIFRFKII